MKYYSEVLDAFYESPEELIKDETEALERQAKKEEEKRAKEESLSKRKKGLASNIQKASEELDKAYEELDLVEKHCKELRADVEKQVKELLAPATESVKKAQQSRINAIAAFNKEFGPYRTTLTSDSASKEILTMDRLINSMFKDFFRI